MMMKPNNHLLVGFLAWDKQDSWQEIARRCKLKHLLQQHFFTSQINKNTSIEDIYQVAATKRPDKFFGASPPPWLQLIIKYIKVPPFLIWISPPPWLRLIINVKLPPFLIWKAPEVSRKSYRTKDSPWSWNTWVQSKAFKQCLIGILRLKYRS